MTKPERKPSVTLTRVLAAAACMVVVTLVLVPARAAGGVPGWFRAASLAAAAVTGLAFPEIDRAWDRGPAWLPLSDAWRARRHDGSG